MKVVMAIEQEELVRLEALALEWVNRNFDISPPLLELPQGEPEQLNRCTIARALNENCEGYWEVHCKAIDGYKDDQHVEGDALASIPVPHEIQLFIRAFDDGYYPELIEQGE